MNDPNTGTDGEEPGDRLRPVRCDCPPSRDPDGLPCWACRQRGFETPNVVGVGGEDKR